VQPQTPMHCPSGASSAGAIIAVRLFVIQLRDEFLERLERPRTRPTATSGYASCEPTPRHPPSPVPSASHLLPQGALRRHARPEGRTACRVRPFRQLRIADELSSAATEFRSSRCGTVLPRTYRRRSGRLHVNRRVPPPLFGWVVIAELRCGCGGEWPAPI